MSNDSTNLPMVTRTPPENGTDPNSGCGTCSTTGCAGGFGIKAGSEKDVVYRNLFIFLLFGVVMIVSSYIIMRIITAILE